MMTPRALAAALLSEGCAQRDLSWGDEARLRLMCRAR